MTRQEFLKSLKQGLAGIPTNELHDIIADYDAHFEEASASGRFEAETAVALGDPRRLAREHLSDIFYREWEQRSHRSRQMVSDVKRHGIPAASDRARHRCGPDAGHCTGAGAYRRPVWQRSLAFHHGSRCNGGDSCGHLLGALIVKFAFFGRDQLNASGHYYGTETGEVINRELDWTPGTAMTINSLLAAGFKATSRHPRQSPWQIEHIRLGSKQLHGRFKWRFFQNNHIRLELEGPTIEKWRVIGGGALYLHEVSQPALRLEVTGSGDIRAAGKVEDTYVGISGSGDVDIGMLTQTTPPSTSKAPETPQLHQAKRQRC